MENKHFKKVGDLLSKTAGLVFFSFLAISLGVVFGLLFDGWVKDQPETAVNAPTRLETVDLPLTSDKPLSQQKETSHFTEQVAGKQHVGELNQEAKVKFRVRVGPYSNQAQAITASGKLKTLGFPVYVAGHPPYAVQVGAFATRGNALKLQKELAGMGYKSFIEP